MDSLQQIAIFSDESNHDDYSKNPTISMLSGNIDDMRKLYKDVDNIFKKYNKKTFKWHKRKSSKYLNISKEIIDLLFSNYNKKFKLISLTWGYDDGRHRKEEIIDTSLNLHFMYQQLLEQILKSYKGNIEVLYFPDQTDSVDWERIRNTLNKNISNPQYALIKEGVNIKEIKECDDKDLNLISVCDLFAGLASNSYNDYEEYIEWKHRESEQMFFDFGDTISYKWNAKKINQFKITEHLLGKTKAITLANKGLTSFSGYKLNFWKYSNTKGYNKAPLKESKKRI